VLLPCLFCKASTCLCSGTNCPPRSQMWVPPSPLHPPLSLHLTLTSGTLAWWWALRRCYPSHYPWFHPSYNPYSTAQTPTPSVSLRKGLWRHCSRDGLHSRKREVSSQGWHAPGIPKGGCPRPSRARRRMTRNGPSALGPATPQSVRRLCHRWHLPQTPH
jgi:hypothetical protein